MSRRRQRRPGELTARKVEGLFRFSLSTVPAANPGLTSADSLMLAQESFRRIQHDVFLDAVADWTEEMRRRRMDAYWESYILSEP